MPHTVKFNSYLLPLSLMILILFYCFAFRLRKNDTPQLPVRESSPGLWKHSAEQRKAQQEVETTHLLCSAARHFFPRSHP